MFTKKPESGESITKMGERPSGSSESKSSPFTERPATYAKGPSPSASASAKAPRIMRRQRPADFMHSDAATRVPGDASASIHEVAAIAPRVSCGAYPTTVARGDSLGFSSRDDWSVHRC